MYTLQFIDLVSPSNRCVRCISDLWPPVQNQTFIAFVVIIMNISISIIIIIIITIIRTIIIIIILTSINIIIMIIRSRVGSRS